MKFWAKTECLAPPPSMTGLTPPLVSTVRDGESAIDFSHDEPRFVRQARLKLSDRRTRHGSRIARIGHHEDVLCGHHVQILGEGGACNPVRGAGGICIDRQPIRQHVHAVELSVPGIVDEQIVLLGDERPHLVQLFQHLPARGIEQYRDGEAVSVLQQRRDVRLASASGVSSCASFWYF